MYVAYNGDRLNPVWCACAVKEREKKERTRNDNGKCEIATLPQKQAALPVLPHPPYVERRRGSTEGSGPMRRYRPRNRSLVEMQHVRRLGLPTGQPAVRQVTREDALSALSRENRGGSRLSISFSVEGRDVVAEAILSFK